MRLYPLLLCTLYCVPAFAHVERQHGAHVHGSAEMNVVLEGQVLEIELEAPGMDIVGFEHAARDAAQESALIEAIAALDSADWLGLPAEAGCTLSKAVFRSHGYEAEKAHRHTKHDDHNGHTHHHDHDEAEDRHGGFHGTLAWTCAQPGALDAIVVHLGQRFPALQRLTVVVLSDRGQQQIVLPGAQGRIPLNP
jgi:hypothetical protein